eukprot:a696786_9.p1 GENE.a696786_9~~a696786_9.p1  ORF type:complete len:140 (-),score=36.28 a696786_9:221-604(-)
MAGAGASPHVQAVTDKVSEVVEHLRQAPIMLENLQDPHVLVAQIQTIVGLYAELADLTMHKDVVNAQLPNEVIYAIDNDLDPRTRAEANLRIAAEYHTSVDKKIAAVAALRDKLAAALPDEVGGGPT